MRRSQQGSKLRIQQTLYNPREVNLKEQGFTLWFTGLSGSGKSTLANILVERFAAAGRYVELLDGDEVRQNLTADLGFSKEDRDTNIRRITFVAKLLSRNGVIAITAAISPYSEARDRARADIDNFVEVYVSAPVEGLCAERRQGALRQGIFWRNCQLHRCIRSLRGTAQLRSRSWCRPTSRRKRKA